MHLCPIILDHAGSSWKLAQNAPGRDFFFALLWNWIQWAEAIIGSSDIAIWFGLSSLQELENTLNWKDCPISARYCVGLYSVKKNCLIFLRTSIGIKLIQLEQSRCVFTEYSKSKFSQNTTNLLSFNPLNPELNPICYLLALLAHHFLHVSRIRVKSLTIRLLMSYIYGAPILDVSRSHTTTHHSR